MAKAWRRVARYVCSLGILSLFAVPVPSAAQTTGSIVGSVVDAATRAPLTGVTIRLVDLSNTAVSGQDGRFLLGAVPVGEHQVRAELIGYKPVIVERVQVRAGRSVEVPVMMSTAPVALPGVVVEAQRVRLVEPDVSTTHEVVVAREIRELPVDRIQDIIELTTGVSDGHFRGGRVGQEVYVIDGLALKNQLEASTAGFGLELSPFALEEIDVMTGGFGAAYGSALSGVVSFATRRGNRERWEGRSSMVTDHWAPESLLRGYLGLGASAGGPINFIGRGSTVFMDIFGQGYLDADPRAAGLTCLGSENVEDDVHPAIEALRTNPETQELYCPYTSGIFPNQQGDKYIAFMRVDRPFSDNVNLTASVLRNRFQRQLYTSEFKYNPTWQLGQRTGGTLVNLALDWTRHRGNSATSITGRTAFMRLDRYLGVIDPESFGSRFNIGALGFQSFDFVGESFARRPIAEQLRETTAIPGYVTPGGYTGSPFGPAAQGIFFTEGTPTLANWSRSDLLALDLSAARFNTTGSAFRMGASGKLYRIETYERAHANLAGSIPNYARFFPGSWSGYAEADIATLDGMHFQFGVRAEAFRSGIAFQFDRGDFLSPVIDSEWKLSFLPRVGAAFPIPGTDGTAIRFSWGRVAQPPDFQYFLDSTIGDSLRTDIRRQGNPNLSFEQGSAYEAGLSHLFTDALAIGVTAFRKNLDNIVSGAVSRGDLGTVGRFSTSDFGSVKGLEFSLRAQWEWIAVRGGYALQKATGLGSGVDSDSAQGGDPARTEYPLAFDRRHSSDLALFVGRAAGAEVPWSGAVTSTIASGYPLFRATPDSAAARREVDRYLPWTWSTDMRASYDLGRLPGCGGCNWRVSADGRNIFNRKNILALRRDNATLAPSISEIQRITNSVTLNAPIPRESPAYSQTIDFNRDGLITPDEFRTARTAAVLDRYDPSLYFGESRQVRLGIEVVF